MKCKKCDNKATVKGLCNNHYRQKKYRENEEYRERVKAYGRKYTKKYNENLKKKNPEYFRERSRKYRKEHPDVFNYASAKCYMKKLSPEQQRKLIYQLKLNSK
jgi:hypothetical protein